MIIPDARQQVSCRRWKLDARTRARRVRIRSRNRIEFWAHWSSVAIALFVHPVHACFPLGAWPSSRHGEPEAGESGYVEQLAATRIADERT